MTGERSMTEVTFVKKLLADGQACAKCRDVERRLRDDGLLGCIDRTVLAIENDPSSDGAVLAARHGVQRAPFFVISRPDGSVQVIESYLAFKRRYTEDESADDLADVVDSHPDLAYI